jgi:NuA3 HAT complex component NTO1
VVIPFVDLMYLFFLFSSESYPWWPAVVHADMNESVPGNILVVHRDKRQKRKVKLYIVQFYDKTSSWCVFQSGNLGQLVLTLPSHPRASVARDKLQYLGEDRGA